MVAVRHRRRGARAGRPVQSHVRSLSDGELTDGCLTCPWHGSVFRVADGAVVRGPATAPQPAFEVCEADGMIQVCLPGAG